MKKLYNLGPRLQCYKTFFMFNSIEHENSNTYEIQSMQFADMFIVLRACFSYLKFEHNLS